MHKKYTFDALIPLDTKIEEDSLVQNFNASIFNFKIKLDNYVQTQHWWTIAQATPEWFELRKFSITSSISFKLIPSLLLDLKNVASNYLKSLHGDEEKDNYKRAVCKSGVLGPSFLSWVFCS